MSDSNNTKKYPVATPEVAKMLKLDVGRDSDGLSGDVHLSAEDLPVAEAEQVFSDNHAQANGDGAKSAFSKIVGNLYIKQNDGQDRAAQDSRQVSGDAHKAEPLALGLTAQASPLKIFLKSFFPYVVIFSAAVFVYFFFFSNVDFSKILQIKAKPSAPKETALQQMEAQNLTAYYAWINQFYFDVSDKKILEPEADNSGNGLSNFQKYLLNLNPKTYDTLNLGMADSEALALGINPSSGTALTDEQRKVLNKYFDMEVIINRLTLAHLRNNRQSSSFNGAGQVAGASLGLRGNFAGQNQATNLYNQNSQNQGNQMVSKTAQNVQSGSSQNNGGQTGAVYTGTAARQNNGGGQTVNNQNFQNSPNNMVLQANDLAIDQKKPGRLEIPSLNINVPVMWTGDPKNFDKDLQSGVVHYPGTAMPGQIGTSYISGHSSNYAWAKGDYKKIFSTLGNLADNSSFKITVVQKDGKDVILHYVVTGRREFKATDQAQFENFPKSVVALSTCWPVGTTQRRLVIFGELSQVER